MAEVVGILALQGGFEAHAEMLRARGHESREVRTASELAECSGLILPGGESTTVMLALERDQLVAPLSEFVKSGKPVLATCAGTIVLSRQNLGLLDVKVERNAYGRQLQSFEDLVEIELNGTPQQIDGVFIRAPKIVGVGEQVEVLASYSGAPVVVRQDHITACTFHPELAASSILHQAVFG